jgi:hypothetical protein
MLNGSRQLSMDSRLRGNDGQRRAEANTSCDRTKKKAGIRAGLNYSHHGKNSGTNRYLGKEAGTFAAAAASFVRAIAFE